MSEAFVLTTSSYRSACQQLMLGQPEVAASRHLEDKLWDAHVRVNGRFRKHLGYVSRPACLRVGSITHTREMCLV